MQRQRSRELREKYSQLVVVRSREEADRLDSFTRQYLAMSPQQEEAYLSTRRNLWTGFGGAKGGAKSVGGVRIAQRDITTSRGGIHLVLRRNYTDLLKTTRDSYDQYFPPDLVLTKNEDVWRCINDWEIWFYAADERKDPNLEKIGGLEVTTVHADEVSQQSVKFYQGIPATLRREAYVIQDDPSAPQVAIPHYIYATFNPTPGQHWTKKYFIAPATRRDENYVNNIGNVAGHRFIKSLPDDNPLLPPTYINVAFGTMEGAMLQMLRYGEFDVDESELQIVPRSDLNRINIDLVVDREMVAAGIDIGLGRPDPTVVYGVNAAGEIWPVDRFEEYDTMKQVTLLDPVCRQVQRAGGRVCIDAGSIGKGVADRLREIFGGTIMPVLFGSRPEPEPVVGKVVQFENRRAQLYWWTRLDVMQASAEIQSDSSPIIRIQVTDNLAEEADNTFYLPDTGSSKIRIEPKELIKERILRSPDDFDTLVLANAARRAVQLSNFVFPSRSRDASQRRRKPSITDGYS
jgi:hypothetical protein